MEQEVAVSLTMYSTTWCGFCARLKSQLGREGIAFTEVDIEQDRPTRRTTRPPRPGEIDGVD